MNTICIIFHIIAAIAAVFLVIGIVFILKGLVFKIEKTIKTGTIITAIAVFFLFSMHMMGAMHHNKACRENCCSMKMKCNDTDFDDCCMMKCDTTLCNDSTSGDNCKMHMGKKMIMKDQKACDPSKCDTSMCKHKCSHE